MTLSVPFQFALGAPAWAATSCYSFVLGRTFVVCVYKDAYAPFLPVVVLYYSMLLD